MLAKEAPNDAASIAAGKKVFKANCSSCHGKEGAGDGPAASALKPPPRNLATDSFKAGDTDEQIFNTITNGLPGSAMAGFKQLAEADRWKVVAFIKSLRKK
ncbi:cytochrome c [bacterium]|nr:cytochrome c [bacterium]